ncbi:MAG TPA: hypothetical protein VGL75_10950 [Acidothermaceae bacterium]|jgi:hypothetical protein
MSAYQPDQRRAFDILAMFFEARDAGTDAATACLSNIDPHDFDCLSDIAGITPSAATAIGSDLLAPFILERLLFDATIVLAAVALGLDREALLRRVGELVDNTAPR